MAVEAPPAGKSGRPWYLVLALLLCSGLGACGATDGFTTIEIYRGTQLDINRELGPDATQDERTALQGALDHMLEAMDAERPRLFPLAAAELVLGGAMFIFAAAAMMGRAGARKPAVQLAVAQALLAIVTFALTPKYRAAQIDFGLVTTTIKSHPPPDMLETLKVFSRGMQVLQLVIRSIVAALIVVALTRRRARAWYEAQSETPTEG